MTASDPVAAKTADGGLPEDDDESQGALAEFDFLDHLVEAQSRRKRLSDAPRVITSAFSVVWRASPSLTLGTILLSFSGIVAILAQVFLTQRAVQSLLGAGRSAAPFKAPALYALLAVSLLSIFVEDATALLQRRLGARVTRVTMDQIFEVTTHVALDAYETPAFYNRMQRVLSSAPTKPLQLVTGVLNTVAGGVGCVGLVATVAVRAPALLPFLLVAAVPVALAGRYSGRLEFAFAVEQAEPARLRAYREYLLTQKDGSKELRSFGTATEHRRRWSTQQDDYLGALGRLTTRRMFLALVSLLMTGVVAVLTLALVLRLIRSGSLDVAQAAGVAVALRLLSQRGRSVLQGVGSLYETQLFLLDVREFLALPLEPQTAPAEADAGMLPAPGEIELRDVSYVYPGTSRAVLRNISFRVRPGETIALVGENGSGKTTLAKVVAGLHAPTAGDILWEGKPIGDRAPHEVRQHIGLVLQDFMRYQLSARENIGLGRPSEDAQPGAVEAAARKAGVAAFVERLPRGYETTLSKTFRGGQDLSVGQWQRLAIARMFHRDSALVVLDEPTAALDPRAEHDLFLQVQDLLRDRSVILISHRFSSVRMADRILVMHDGEIVEQGTHAELVTAGGRYQEMFTLQASAYLSEPRV